MDGDTLKDNGEAENKTLVSCEFSVWRESSVKVLGLCVYMVVSLLYGGESDEESKEERSKKMCLCK